MLRVKNTSSTGPHGRKMPNGASLRYGVAHQAIKTASTRNLWKVSLVSPQTDSKDPGNGPGFSIHIVRYLRRYRRRSVRLRRQLIVQADADDVVADFAVDREAA